MIIENIKLKQKSIQICTINYGPNQKSITMRWAIFDFHSVPILGPRAITEFRFEIVQNLVPLQPCLVQQRSCIAKALSPKKRRRSDAKFFRVLVISDKESTHTGLWTSKNDLYRVIADVTRIPNLVAIFARLLFFENALIFTHFH